MKKTGKILALVIALSMLLCASAFASGEAAGESQELVVEAFTETVSYNDTTYGYGEIELVVSGEASSDGTIVIASVSWDGYDVTSYMTEAIEAELEVLLAEAGVVPAAGEAAVTEFTETVSYNDTTYGYGEIELVVSGEASSDGTIVIGSVSWDGYDVTSYMTEAIEAELDALLTEAGVVPAAGGVVVTEFTETVSYNDTTYGYGEMELVVSGEASSDGTIVIGSVSWDGYDVTSYMTEAIEAELDALLTAAGVVPAAGEGAVTEFTETVSYNDTTYGYGEMELVVSGEASSDGTIVIDNVSWDGYDVTSYMTEAIETELDALLSAVGYGA